MLGPFATTSRLTPIHQMSLAVLSRAACASTSTTTTTTTRDKGDRYGPMEWAQSVICNRTAINMIAKQVLVNKFEKLPLSHVTDFRFAYFSADSMTRHHRPRLDKSLLIQILLLTT